MSLLLVSLLLASAVALVVWASRVHGRLEQEAHEARASRARQRGWSYEVAPAPRVDYRFSGHEDGIAWLLEFESDGEGGGKAMWKTTSVRAQRPELLIVHRTVDNLMQGRFGKWLGRRIAANSAKLEFAMGLYGLPHRVETGSEEFSRQFVARSQEPALARQVLDHRVQQLLSRQPGVSVALTSRGLEIEGGPKVKDLDAIEDVIRIGCAVARHLHRFKAVA